MARDYRAEYDNYQGSEEQKRNRAKRNKARRTMEREGKVHKGDGKDVDHRVPLSKGGSNSPGNWRVQTKGNNRDFRRDSKGRPL